MFTTTVNQLAERMKVDYPVASNLIKLMEATGKAKIVGKTKPPKGKPSNIYEVAESFTVNLKAA